MPDTTTMGQIKNPNRQKAGFIQASAAPKTIRRVSEQTSPQVARVVGLTQRWDEDGGLCSGSSAIRHFHIRKVVSGGQ
ncbi:MAG: hypothetical protein II336_00755 [Loktanella sp.]|nr:hypothetical protein [Loktanella sp.]